MTRTMTVSLVALGLLATLAQANAKMAAQDRDVVIVDAVGEHRPARTIFDQIRESAPRSVFDQLRDRAP